MTDPKYYRPGIEPAIGKLVEECGEVLAAVGKTIRWGLESTNPEIPAEERERNADWIIRETHDLLGAIDNIFGELRKLGYRTTGD